MGHKPGSLVESPGFILKTIEANSWKSPALMRIEHICLYSKQARTNDKNVPAGLPKFTCPYFPGSILDRSSCSPI